MMFFWQCDQSLRFHFKVVKWLERHCNMSLSGQNETRQVCPSVVGSLASQMLMGFIYIIDTMLI